jgi:hypothetical protein
LGIVECGVFEKKRDKGKGLCTIAKQKQHYVTGIVAGETVVRQSPVL